jgi:4-oxalocrotonate tautomerase
MPLINVKLIEGVFSADQKHDVIERLTDAMVSVEGENMRGVTWCVVEGVKSGDWGIAGNPLTTEAYGPWRPANPSVSRLERAAAQSDPNTSDCVSAVLGTVSFSESRRRDQSDPALRPPRH